MMPMLFLYSGRVWPTPQAVKYGLVDGDLYVSRDPYTSFKNVLH